jgi:hypothetical protein
MQLSFHKCRGRPIVKDSLSVKQELQPELFLGTQVLHGNEHLKSIIMS